MPDIHDVMDVTMDELSPEQQVQLKDAIDQFQQKCLMSFGKNRSGVPYLKSDMPRVLLPGETDTTSAEEKMEVMNAVQQTMESIMAKHNTAFLNMFRQMMVGVFGPGMERVLGRVSPQGSTVEVGETSAAVNSQPARGASAQPPLQSTGGGNQSSRLHKAWEVSQSSRLCKARGAVQSSSRTLIRQCLIGLLMENWHSTLLEFHPTLLIE
jgi:hypothetical protein